LIIRNGAADVGARSACNCRTEARYFACAR